LAHATRKKTSTLATYPGYKPDDYKAVGEYSYALGSNADFRGCSQLPKKTADRLYEIFEWAEKNIR